MDEKQLQALFDEMKSKLELGDFATFKNQIGSDEKFRKAFYTEASRGLDLGGFDAFNESFKKKVSTTPSTQPAAVSTPKPVATSPSALPSPSGLTYNDIELVIEDARKKARRLQDLNEAPTSSAGIGAPGTIIPKATLDRANQEMQLAENKKKEVIAQYQRELSRPVEKLIETGEYKGFFTQDGVFDEAKARDYFKKVTQKFGGGSHLQDQWLVNLKTRGQQEIDKPRFNQILGEEMGKQKLDLNQYSTQVFNQLTQQQRATADSLKKERDTEALKLLKSAEAKANQYAEELNNAVNGLNEQIKAGFITNEAAAAAYDQLVKQYETTIKGIDNGYKDAIRKMNVRINGKFDRIEQEVKAINASIDGDKVMQSLPPDVRKKLELAYQTAGQRLSTEKNEARKKLDTVTGIGTTDAVSRTVNLALKGLTSGFNRGLAEVGEYLNMKGLSGSFVDALRNRRTAAETFAPAQYEWNKDEWLKRAVSSTATSLGASAPILLPTIGAVALTGGGAAGALAAGALSFAGESAQIGGGQFREGLEETGDVGAATQRAEEVMRQNMITAPLYFIGGLGDVMITTGKGLSKVATGIALEQVEEIPTEYIQSFNEAKAKGYKKGIGDFIKENPEIAADTFISTIGQSGAMKGIASAFSVFQKNVPASTTQMLTDAVSKNGVEFTNGLIDKWFEAGKINEKTVAKLKAEVTKIQSQLPKLQEAGVDGDKAKLMSSLSSQAQELQNKINTEKDPAVKALYQNQLNVVNQDISQLVKGETPYVVFTLPGGGEMTRVMTVREFNALPAESSNDMVKNSDGIQVVGDDALNTQLTQKKQELGVPEAAPGVFTQAPAAQELSITETKPAEQIEKKEAIKQKNEFITDTDFVQEAFTPEEDAADREALPESQFQTEEELSNFLETSEYAMLTGQNPEAIPLSKEANRKLNEKAQQWLSSRGLTAVPIFGKYGNSERSFMVPGMTKQQAIEFAKEFQQDSVAHSSGLVYQDGSFNPRQEGVNLSPQFDQGGDNFSTINVGGKKVDFKISYDFANKVQPTKPVADRLRTAVFGDTEQKVSSAQKALEKTGVVIQMIEDPNEFDSKVAQLGGQKGMEGVFLSDTGEIVINKQKLDQGIADGRVIWHEASHPVVNIVRNTNPQLFAQVVAGLRQAAADNKGVADAIAWAESNYAQEGQGVVDDEAVVETIAGIAEGMIDISKLPTGIKQSIIDLINRIARALGFNQVLDDTDIAAFKKLAGDIANALTTGQDIAEVVGAENVKEYLNTVEAPGIVTGGEMVSAAQPRLTSEPAVNVYESKEVQQLPQRSLGDVYQQYEGKAVVINSDPTRVGELTLPSGKKIFMYGGPAYLSIKDNVDSNVGFATTQIGKVNTWMKYVKEVFGDKPGVTLVASQAPTSILSNSYALRYVMDAISMLPKSVLRSSDFKNEFFGKDLVLLKDAFGEKAYNEFVNKYKKADLSDPKVIDDMIAEMGYKVGDDNKPASFKARGAFVSNLLGGIADKASIKGVEGDKGYVSKKPNKFIAKQLMDRLGINAEKVMREIGEPSLVDLYMNEGNWGFAVAGFETDPNMSVETVQQGGVKHPLFNAKFPGKNPFILDGAYELNKMFTPVEITGPSGMPYTKTAAQMLAGSMYVKGQPLAEGGSFEYVRTSPAGRRIQERRGNLVADAGLDNKMTSDDQGNYLFYHYSDRKLKAISPSKFGKNLATGRDERPGIGISMYYTRPDVLEAVVPADYGYAVRVPEQSVYPFNEDPLDLLPAAEQEFNKKFPGQAFDMNKQVAFVTQEAAKRGYPMTVAEWNIKGTKALRAQTTEEFKPEVYRELVPGTMNQYKFNPELDKFKPNRKGRIQASRGNRMESSKDFKLAAFVMREKADGAPMSEIVSGIASVFPNMSPQEIKDLVDDPETWLRNKYANLSKAMQDNLIARARVKNIYAPRTGAIAPAFQGLEVPMAKIEEATQAPTFKERVDKVFTNFKNKFIDSAKGLPDWIISLKDFAGGTKQIEISKAELTIRQLKEVAKKIGFTDWDTFSAALKSIPQPIQQPVGSGAGMVAFNPSVAAAGAPFTIPNNMLPQTTPPAIQALPLEIIPFVYQMRGQIDGLTKDLIGSGYVTPEQAAKLESNIGQYVNRAYRLYNEKGWKPSQEQIRETTKFLADQYIKQLATDNAGVLTYEQVEKQAIEKAKRDVNEILDKKTNPYFAAKSESRNMGILKERKDIPEPIRKLMGEYTDPGTVFIMTVAKQAALKASSEYLTKVRNMGMGTLFFEENDPNRPASASVQIAAEGSDTKSPLNGLYTTPEVAEAMETVNPTYNEVVNLWMKAVGAVRWGKTVGSVKTQLLNFESNLGFAVMNGLLMTGATGKAFNESRKYVGGQYSNKELGEITQKVIQLGLVGQGVNATELAKMLGSGDIHDIALDLAVNPESKYRMAKKAPGKALGVLNKLYRMGDDFWKVYAYMNERELVAGAMFDKKYNELTDEEKADVDIESSERVKSTWPTYDRVFPAVKAISQNTPIFGNFISFRAESIRVLANTIAMAIRDLKTPGFEGLGARRMAGILSYIAIRSGVTYAFAQAVGMAASGLTGLLFGGDDEEERKKRAIKQAAPSFMATQDLAVIPTKDKHKFVVYSLSGIDPYNTTFNTLNALTDGTATMKPGPAAAFTEFFGGFLSPEMTFNTAWSILTNTNPKNGDRIVGATDEGADAYAKIGAYLFDELKPSTIGMVQRLAGDNPAAELSSLVGARPYEVDLHKSFSFALSDMGKQMEEITRAYNRVKFNEKSTEDDKALALKEAGQKKALLIGRMNQRFNDYVLLGANPEELKNIILERSQIKTTGFDIQTKLGIMDGQINPETLYK